ncbi:MAG: hydrogenase nickel incorporation protein HypB [Bacillota bacterium]
MQVKLVSNVLKANDQIAADNRRLLARGRTLVVNLMSSPGSGKTTLLERTIAELGEACPVAVVEGDLFTTRDADRIERLGVPVVQINTEGGCHLDAQMVRAALEDLPWEGRDILFIENVGNLVCPAAWDLGEDLRVAMVSVSEGDDKPAKYPRMFREAAAVVVNKVDLLSMTDFSLDRLEKDLRLLNPAAPVFHLSARTGEGLAAWVAWLRGRVAAKRDGAATSGVAP